MLQRKLEGEGHRERSNDREIGKRQSGREGEKHALAHKRVRKSTHQSDRTRIPLQNPNGARSFQAKIQNSGRCISQHQIL